MVINGTNKIDPKKGDYILLSDLGCEGITVVEQFKTPDKALEALATTDFSRLTIVELTQFHPSTFD